MGSTKRDKLVCFPCGLESPEEAPEIEGVYIFHFKTKRAHAGHYVGWSNNIRLRFKAHRKAKKHPYKGAKTNFMGAMNELGIQYVLAGIWPGEGREFEAYLKNVYRNGHELCPICNPRKSAQRKAPDPVTIPENMEVSR